MELPTVGKRRRPVEPYAAKLIRFRHHVKVAAALKHVRVREVKRLGEHDPLINPAGGIGAGSKPDLSPTVVQIPNLKEHAPSGFGAYQERIGDEACIYI